MENNNQQGQINIELDEQTAEGTYSNLAIINHSNSEFVVDFVTIMPGVPKAKVKSRIILTPQHAKRLLKALGENIHRFEAAHGKIEESEQPPIPLNFGLKLFSQPHRLMTVLTTKSSVGARKYNANCNRSSSEVYA